MLLTKKSEALGSNQRSPFVHSLRRGLAQALPTMDRRAFLRRSGLGVGVGLAASQLTLVKKAQAALHDVAVGKGKLRSSAPCARTARWAARWMRSWKTVFGSDRSPCLTRPSIWVRTAPRALHCASTATVSTVCATP